MGKRKAKNPPLQYDSQALQDALEALSKGQSLRLVSDQYNIPKSTLSDKMRGVSNPVIMKRGPQSVLGAENEQRLVDWIAYMSEMGFAITKQHLMTSVQRLLESSEEVTVFTENRPGRTWFNNFRTRHPELCERLAQNMLCTRVLITEDKIRGWFDRVRDYLKSKDLLDIAPSRIFNCDESGFHLYSQGQRVLTKVGNRATYNFVQNDEKEAITALFCGNAVGQLLPPMVMLNYVRIPHIVSQSMPKGWPIGRSDSGWMTAASFYEWMANFFYKWLIGNNIQLPVVLYLDGHTSHLTLELSDFCRSRGIELIALLPNSIHITQPMDVAVFHAVKASWKKAVPNWKIENGGARVKRQNFSGILRTVVDGLNWEKILASGFRATGLYPFTPDAINYDNLVKKTSQGISTSDTTISPTDTSLSTYLDFVERRIDQNLLKEFKLVAEGCEWTGDINQRGLFQFWLGLKAEVKSHGLELAPATAAVDSNVSKISQQEALTAASPNT